MFINLNPTPDSPFAVDLGNGYARGGANASLPLDLGDGLALAADAVEAAYAHVETGGRGGWYPVGDNTIWHGGVHLRPDPDDPAAPRTVHACLPGRVVAARLGAGDAAEGPFGSRNFVLVRHEAPAPPDAEDGASSAGDTPSPAAEPPPFYSLYMHLAPLADDRSGPAQAGASTETLRTTTRVNYRSAPAMDASLVVGTAPRQTRVERLPEAAQAARNTDAFAWSRVHLAEGAVEAYVTTDPQYVERAGPAPVTVEAVSWLQKVSPETFETTTGLNYRSAPVVRDETWLGTAEKGTRVEPLSDAPQAALETGHFRWARIHLSSGPVEAFISTNSQYVRSTRTSELDTDLLDRLATGEVVAVDREVGAGDVLWTVGTHGLRSLPDDPLPETLHWEMISESNLVADLCRPVEPDVSGDGQAGSPPTSRVSPPLSSRTVLVRRAEGPSTVEAGQPATFRAADFNVSPTPDERARVNWEVRAGDAVVATFRSAGDRLVYTPPVALAGETIEVRPFARSSTAQVSVRTRVEAPPPWWAAEDPDADFQTDAAEVLGLFERLDTTILGTDLFAERVVVAVEARREGATPARPSLERDTAGADPAGHLAHDELATFYTADVGGRATRLRHAACRFVSEWGVSDVPAAVAALGVGAPEATAKAVERHQWWAEAVAAGAGLPAEPRLWHYHPLSLLVHIAGSLAETESPDADGGGDQTVVWGQRVSPEFKSRVLQMSDTLQIDADYLMAIMAFESAETFSPSIWNQAGSRAVGLIQFMDGAASEPDLNTTLEALEAMTAVEQLDYVERYFRMRQRQFGKITTLSDVYMAVLRPANIGDPESAVLFRAGTTAYRQNDGLDSDGNGEITKAECAAKVQEKLERGERFRG
ncbi:hypothetical protein [Rubrivirga sp.]|uniref:hypothetical protein n=1 Tax=Rubrivirga sp. TaxID=1885344 RepID=UPI003B517FF5